MRTTTTQHMTSEILSARNLYTYIHDCHIGLHVDMLHTAAARHGNICSGQSLQAILLVDIFICVDARRRTARSELAAARLPHVDAGRCGP